MQHIIISDDLRSAVDPALEGHLLHAWCPQGSCRFVFNEREYTLQGGDCMIIPRRGDMMRDIVPSSDFRVEIVYVSEAFIGVSTPQSNYGMRGGLALFNNPIMHLDEEQQRVCALNFDYIRRRLAVEKHHFHRDAMINAIQCMIIDFFDFHVENYGGIPWQSGDISAQQAQLMERLQEMLERGDCREHREVKYYADALCVTPKYLSEVSRLVSGYSASYWIARYTALDISRSLRDRTLSIEAVADLFHFSSLSHFSRYVQWCAVGSADNASAPRPAASGSELFCQSKNSLYFCKVKLIAKTTHNMCTISLSYDQNNALAQRKLDELLRSGLFKLNETVADRELRELERRMDAYERGEMATVPHEEVYKRVTAVL